MYTVRNCGSKCIFILLLIYCTNFTRVYVCIKYSFTRLHIVNMEECTHEHTVIDVSPFIL